MSRKYAIKRNEEGRTVRDLEKDPFTEEDYYTLCRLIWGSTLSRKLKEKCIKKREKVVDALGYRPEYKPRSFQDFKRHCCETKVKGSFIYWFYKGKRIAKTHRPDLNIADVRAYYNENIS